MKTNAEKVKINTVKEREGKRERRKTLSGQKQDRASEKKFVKDDRRQKQVME